jgi:hypothetical protein
VTVGTAFWLLAASVLALAMAAPLVRGWTGAVEAPHLHADGLSWRMRHVRAGERLACALWLLLGWLIMGPSLALALYAPPPPIGAWLLRLLVLALMLMLVLAAMSRWFTLAVRVRGELQASADGLVWKRCWPLQSRRWTWRELRSIQARPEAMVLRTGADEYLLDLPGARDSHIRAVVSVLEATRAAPPPEAEPVPEVPQALRQMQRRKETT